MWSRCATARASSIADTPQHALNASSGSGSQSGHRFIVRPTTSWPSAASSPAATELSTPPLIATAHLPTLYLLVPTTRVNDNNRCEEVSKTETGSGKQEAVIAGTCCSSCFPLPVTRFRIAFDPLPPRPQPAADLGFESMLSGLVVDVTGHTVGQILLWNKSIWVVVRVLVALTVTQLFHRLRMAGVSKVHRDRIGTLLLNIVRGRTDGPDHGVALRSGGDIDGSFRHGNLRFRQTDVLHSVGGRCRDDECHRVGHPDILRRVDHHPSGDVPGILPRREHPHQPVHGGVGIRPPHALNKRRDMIVVRVAFPLIDQRPRLGDLLHDLHGDGAGSGWTRRRRHRRNLKGV